MTLSEKLHPRRFTNMSPKMAAIVGYILGKPYTDPEINDIIITNDDFVLAQCAGDIGFNAFLGSRNDLETNWHKLLTAANDLTDDEREAAQAKYNAKIHKIHAFPFQG